MKGALSFVAVAAGFSQVIATGFHNAKPFTNPDNTDNKCSDDIKPGLDWSDLPTGGFDSYKGFKWSGFSCTDKFAKRDVLADRTYQSKCITGKATKSKDDSPKVSCDKDQGNDKTSIKEFHVTPEFDCDLEFHYNMPDGSTCKHRSACSKSGTNVKNTQCGGATDVVITFPDQENVPKDDCEFGIPSMVFDCETASSTPPSSPSTSSYPANSPPTSYPVTASSSSPATTGSYPAETPSYPAETPSYPAETPSYPADTPTSSYPASSPPESTSGTSPATTSSYPAETPSYPAETPSSYPAESTSTSPVESTSSSPAESTSTYPADTPSSYPAESTSTSPVESTSSSPAESTSTYPADTPSSYPAESTSTSPVESTSTSPVESTSSSPAESTSTYPADTPSSYPAESPSSYPAGSPSSYPAGSASTTPIASSSTEAIPVTSVTSYMTTSTAYTTVVSTVTSCGPTVTNCPAGSTAVVTETIAVSTTVCPVTETFTTIPTGKPEVPATTASNSPVESNTPVAPMPYPDVLPSCLNTFMYSIDCKDNTDAACYCPDATYTQNVFECLYAHGASDEETAEAISYFQGICRPYVETNPGIVTCPGTITNVLTAVPTPAPTAVYTTIEVVATTVVPCTDSAGVEIPSSSTTVYSSITVSVPDVAFTTVTDSPGTTDVVFVPGPSATAAPSVAPTGGATPTATGTAAPYPTGSAFTTFTTGTGGIVPTGTASATAPFATAGAPRLGAGLGFFGLVAAAVAAL